MFDAYSAGINAGLDPSLATYMPRFVQIESGGNPNAQTGSYSGVLQMGPAEAAKYGGNGLSNGASMYADNAKWFQQKYGRPPSPTELYLTAQQGEGGLAAHMANPDAPAWQNMASTAEGRQKGADWAKQAIWGNVPADVRAQFPGGVDSLTSAQFMDLWKHKVEQTPMQQQFAANRTEQMNPIQQQFAQQGAQDNTYAYAPQYDQNAGLFDRLRQGGPGALFGAPGGVFPGANGRPGYDLGNRLQRAAVFGLAANNPSALGGLNAVNAENSRKMAQIGTDEYGNPKYGIVDEHTGMVTPLQMTGQGNTGASSDTGNVVSGAINKGLTGEDLLKNVPPAIANQVRMIANGNMSYNQAAMSRQPSGRMINAVLAAYDPGYSLLDYEGRAAAAKAYSGNGSMAQVQARLPQMVQHFQSLKDAADNLGNTSVPLVNNIKNTVSEQLGGGAPTAWRLNAAAAADEVARLMRAGNMSDASVKQWEGNLSENMSPDQQRAAIGKLHELAQAAISAQASQRARALGAAQDARMGPYLDPKSQASFDALGKWASGGDARATALPKGVNSIKLIQ